MSITPKRVIQILSFYKKYDSYGETTEALDIAMAAVLDQFAHRWIPVKATKKPEVNEYVLITYKVCNMDMVGYACWNGTDFITEGEKPLILTQSVTAWAKKPSPYQEINEQSCGDSANMV